VWGTGNTKKERCVPENLLTRRKPENVSRCRAHSSKLSHVKTPRQKKKSSKNNSERDSKKGAGRKRERKQPNDK
jgi:hypothetical protein